MKKVINILLLSILALLLINVANSYSQNCGPGPHWVDQCAAGTDTIDCSPSQSTIIVEVEFPQNDCVGPFTRVTFLGGPTIIRRSAPNSNGCTPPGHLCRIETEIVSLSLTSVFQGNPTTLTVGAGRGLGPLGNLLRPTFGTIIEDANNPTQAFSSFKVFYEIRIDLPGPNDVYLYNYIEHEIGSFIKQVPPPCVTMHTSGSPLCTGVFNHPIPGQGQKVANVIARDHALPVELSSFNSSINERNITLNWTTATEENNSGFEVERSMVNPEGSGQVSERSMVGFVQGHGTVTTPTNYNFEDRNLSSGRYKYRLKQIDYNGNFQYFNLQNDVFIGTPEKFSLSQNYPNPFNPTTKINYDISKDGLVKLIIYDNNGREVKTVVNEFKSAGYYTVDFEVVNLQSGVYFYKLESNNLVASKKMVILK